MASEKDIIAFLIRTSFEGIDDLSFPQTPTTLSAHAQPTVEKLNEPLLWVCLDNLLSRKWHYLLEPECKNVGAVVHQSLSPFKYDEPHTLVHLEMDGCQLVVGPLENEDIDLVLTRTWE